MGISGLLPLLRSIHKQTSLKKFSGQTIGVDAYGWLHRGTVACAIELALGRPTTKYIDFAVNRVRMLLDFGITPYLVFDGDALPSKSHTNDERRRRREESKAAGLELYKSGKMSQAYQELQKSAGVTPLMARQFIEELKKLDVPYLVAPFEADAQLSYLERQGIINGVLSEDSDLLVFGVQRLLTKLDQYGDCVEINRSDFPLCKEISLVGWTDTMFRQMAILSGCDYLQNIEKMGLKTAYRFIRKYKDGDKAIRMIAFEGKFRIPSGYQEQFHRANLTFIHHRVFCPIQKRMVFLNELTPDQNEEDMPYLGRHVDAEIALGVACGDLNPKTKAKLDISVFSRSRPSLSEQRRSTFTNSHDLKQKKSIDSFFHPHRRPLAELDPNSLTPSPSQQRLLERHRNSNWEPRPVSSAPQLRQAASSNLHVTSSQATSHNSDRRRFLTKASTVSSYQAPKRQRLCSNVEDASSAEDFQQSPFFTTEFNDASPLASKKRRDRKTRRAEFDVWSDDSVEQIMLGFEEVQEANTPQQKTGNKSLDTPASFKSSTELVIDNIPQSPPPRSNEPTHKEISTENVKIRVNKRGTSVLSSPSPEALPDDDLDKFEDLLEYHVRQKEGALAKTFAYQSPERQQKALHTLKTLSRSTSNIKLPHELSNRRTASLSQEPELVNKVDLRRTFGYQSVEQQKLALESLSQTPHEKIEVGREALSKIRSRIPEDVPASKTLVSSPIKGSEDAIIPNSEDEGTEFEDDSVGPTLHLDRFTYDP